MALFRSTADMKFFTDVHKQTDWATLKIYVEQAETTYIIPVIGQAMYQNFINLMNDPANALKTFDQIFTDEKNLTAYNGIGRSLANYAMFEAFPFLNTAVGDIGIAQQSSKEGTTQPAAQWRYESRRLAHLDNGDRFTDQLLIYLETNKDFFTDWASSSSYTISKDLFISDSYTLSNYIGTNNSRRAYLALRSHIRMSEKKYVVPAIGQELFDELKNEIKQDNVTDDNKVLLPMIQEGLAWASYYEALPFLVLKFNTDGVSIISTNDSIVNKQAAGLEEKALARSTAAHNMETFLGSLKNFLIDNSITYPLFTSSTAASNGTPRYTRVENHWCSGMFRV